MSSSCPARNCSNSKDGWSQLAKSLKAEIDPNAIEAYKGTRSLPFALGDNRCIAVKIIDDRGIESLKIERNIGAQIRKSPKRDTEGVLFGDDKASA